MVIEFFVAHHVLTNTAPTIICIVWRCVWRGQSLSCLVSTGNLFSQLIVVADVVMIIAKPLNQAGGKIKIIVLATVIKVQVSGGFDCIAQRLNIFEIELLLLLLSSAFPLVCILIIIVGVEFSSAR